MIKFENKQKSIDINEISEIYCNYCGEKIKKNADGYFDDYVEVNKQWGYHSNFDGETHTFHICGECYEKITEKFVIKP